MMLDPALLAATVPDALAGCADTAEADPARNFEDAALSLAMAFAEAAPMSAPGLRAAAEVALHAELRRRREERGGRLLPAWLARNIIPIGASVAEIRGELRVQAEGLGIDVAEADLHREALELAMTGRDWRMVKKGLWR